MNDTFCVYRIREWLPPTYFSPVVYYFWSLCYCFFHELKVFYSVQRLVLQKSFTTLPPFIWSHPVLLHTPEVTGLAWLVYSVQDVGWTAYFCNNTLMSTFFFFNTFPKDQSWAVNWFFQHISNRDSKIISWLLWKWLLCILFVCKLTYMWKLMGRESICRSCFYFAFFSFGLSYTFSS